MQAIRAFAIALAVLGLVALFLTGGQLLVWEDVLWAAISLGAVVVGAGLAWWARRRVRELDATNRPFLIGEGGAEIMRARGRNRSQACRACSLAPRVVCRSRSGVLLLAQRCELWRSHRWLLRIGRQTFRHGHECGASTRPLRGGGMGRGGEPQAHP